jgi:hypothetical protein
MRVRPGLFVGCNFILKITAMKTIIILLFSFFIFHLTCVEAQDTIYVPQDYSTIQSGIDASTDGDVVLVNTGTYVENINFNGKAITVASYFLMYGDTNHINNTIIDGDQNGSVVTFITGEDTTSVICGFTITGGTGTYISSDDRYLGGGILCYYAAAKITHNKIVGNEVQYTGEAAGGGVACFWNSEINWLILKNNTISENTCWSTADLAQGGGLYSSISTICHNNDIINNSCIGANDSEADGGGIFIEEIEGSGLMVDLKNNIIHHNTLSAYYVFGGGIVIVGSTGQVEGNEITNNVGIAGYQALGGGLMRFYSSGELYLMNNVISYNELEAERTFGTGAMIINASDTVFITNNLIAENQAAGTYACWGGGLHLQQDAVVQVLHNQVIGNLLDGAEFSIAAGIYVDRPEGISVIRNNLIKDNSCLGVGRGGGLNFYEWDSPEIYVEIDGNVFENNVAEQGGGLWTFNFYNILISNNVFRSNGAATNGGAIRMNHYDIRLPQPVIENKFISNGRDKLGRQGRDVMHPILVNNTFFNNAANYGGAIYCNHQDEFPIIMNSIFWENDASVDGDEIYLAEGSQTIIAHCDLDTLGGIYGSWSGFGNIFTDPGFIDDECHIDGVSPCVDMGIDSLELEGIWYYAPDHDLDGKLRPYGDGYIDIGACEADVFPGMNEFNTHHSPFNIQIYPNPTRGIFNLQFTIYDLQSISVAIHDMHGREVMRVLDKMLPAGEHEVQADLSGLPEGVYFCKLAVGSWQLAVKKVIVVR